MKKSSKLTGVKNDFQQKEQPNAGVDINPLSRPLLNCLLEQKKAKKKSRQVDEPFLQGFLKVVLGSRVEIHKTYYYL